MLRLGFTRTDIISMPYSRAAWYVEAVATEKVGNPDGGVREATQADIDAF